jgi:PAS domain S-box-containing protein
MHTLKRRLIILLGLCLLALLLIGAATWSWSWQLATGTHLLLLVKLSAALLAGWWMWRELRSFQQNVATLENDATEKAAAMTQLRASEERFATIFRACPNPMSIVCTEEWVYLDVNDQWLSYGQFARDEVIGKHVNELNVWGSMEERNRFLETLQRDGCVRNFESFGFTKGEMLRYGLLSADYLKLDGRVCILTTIQDITLRRQQEQELKQQEENFRRVFLHNPIPMVVVRIADHMQIATNESYLRTSGFNEKEAINVRTDEMSALITPIERNQLYQQLQDQGYVAETEVRLQAPNGLFDALISAALIQFEGEACALWTMQNITERKATEQALRQSEARFRALTETSQAAILVLQGEQVVYANPAIQAMSGYSREEFGATSILETVHADSHAFAAERLRARAAGANATMRNELRIKTKSGTARWLDYSATEIEFEGRPALLFNAFDITERKEADELFRLAFTNNPVPLSVTRLSDGQQIEVNEMYLQESGWTRAEVIGKTPMETGTLLTPEQLENIRQQLTTHGNLRDLELQIALSHGLTDWMASAELLTLRGEPCVLWALRDITERKRAELALQQSETKFRVLTENLQAAVLMYREQEDRIIYGNPAVERVFGYAPAEISPLNMFDIVHPEFRELILARRAARALGQEVSIRNEIKVVTKQGKTRWLDYAVEQIEYDGQPTLVQSAYDITERKQAEEALAASRAQLRQLAARLQSIREEERADIAREIHDELGQILTGMKFQLKWFEDSLPNEELKHKATAMGDLVNYSIRAVRRIAMGLRPSLLDDFGLVAAIEWQAKEFQNLTGIEIEMLALPEGVEFSREQATALFRLFQEMLTNVARHAQAEIVTVDLRLVGDTVKFTLRDNGCGIQPERIQHTQSTGLTSMRERAEMFGGTFSISGATGKGTTVEVQMPYAPPSTTNGATT